MLLYKKTADRNSLKMSDLKEKSLKNINYIGDILGVIGVYLGFFVKNYLALAIFVFCISQLTTLKICIQNYGTEKKLLRSLFRLVVSFAIFYVLIKENNYKLIFDVIKDNKENLTFAALSGYLSLTSSALIFFLTEMFECTRLFNKNR